jgi:hypothetical protein
MGGRSWPKTVEDDQGENNGGNKTNGTPKYSGAAYNEISTYVI